MGKSEHNALASRMIVLLAHLLKWQFQPERRQTGHSWEVTINTQREEISRLIENRPNWKNETGNLNWFQKI